MKINGRRGLRDADRAQRDAWRAAYIASNDTTGYLFAEEFVEDGWRGWKSILDGKDKRVLDEIKEWQDALAVKLQAQGIVALTLSDKPEAAKWLAGKGWLPREDARTKDARKRAEKVDKEVEKDLARLSDHLGKPELRLVKAK